MMYWMLFLVDRNVCSATALVLRHLLTLAFAHCAAFTNTAKICKQKIYT